MTTTATKNDVLTLKTNVPSHWKVVPLGEVLTDIVGGGTPSKSNPSYWKGSIPWLSIKDMRTRRPADAIDHISEEAVQYSSTNIIPADTVIIATRVGLGKVVRVPYDSAINQDLKALIAGPELDKSYLEYWMTSIADYLESIGSGTTVKGIRLEQLRSIPFPLAPLNEQKLIVAEIEKQFSRLDEAVANLKRIKANLNRYKISVLKAAVEGKLTEEWRKAHSDVEPASELLKRILAERRKTWEETELAKMKAKRKKPKDNKWKEKYKEPNKPDISQLPMLPSGWTWASPEQLAAPINYALSIGPFGSNLKVSDYKDAGVPLVFVRSIRSQAFDNDNTKYVSVKKAKELLAHEVQPGDILITKMGAPPGDACLYPLDMPKAIITADCIKWTLSSILNKPSFFVNAINSQLLKTQILGITQGVAQLKVSLGRFRSIAVPFPSLNEQTTIVAEIESRLSLASVIEFNINANLIRAERLRHAVLNQAFLGTLNCQ